MHLFLNFTQIFHVIIHFTLSVNTFTIYSFIYTQIVHGANMGPTWVLSAPDWPHVGPMNLAIRVILHMSGSLESAHPGGGRTNFHPDTRHYQGLTWRPVLPHLTECCIRYE